MTHRVIESHRVAMVTIRIGLCVTLPNYNVRSYSTIRCQYSDRWNYAWFALGVGLTAVLFVFEISSRGRDSSVGIATRYGLDDPGIESRWGEIFRTGPDRPWGPPSLLYNRHRVFPGGKAAGAWR